MSKKVLLVDDEQDFVDMIKIRLEANDYEVKVAGDGIQALAVLKKEKFDAVLLDILMPQLDGLTVLEIIKRDYKDLPVFMITAFANEQRFDAAIKLGAAGFISKTRDLQTEIQNITTVLGVSDRYRG